MKSLRCFLLAIATLTACFASNELKAQTTPAAGMMRFPDVSAEHIVFVFGEDLWIAPRTGGMASPLAAPRGEESMPRFSPDGKTVAFVGNYEGNEDLYTIPVGGGTAHRVTYHPANEDLCDWTPDGKLLFSSNGYAGLGRQDQLFTQAPDAPMESALPVPYGTNGAIGPDGKWLAYTPHSHDNRTWKRYRGGMASNIWLFNLETKTSKQMTDFEGTDSFPMWQGETVYYLCDGGPEHRLNIWSYNISSDERKQVTKFADDDCKWPSIGPGTDGKGEIVFQNGKSLFLLDLKTEKTNPLTITIPGDRPALRSQMVDASKFIQSVQLSPSAKRLLMEARGDLWTVPVKNGSPRNLTRTSGIAEREPSWSPDGQWIAYLSDATGEYELYTTQSDGLGETRQLTKDGNGYRYNPQWSPDSKWITYCDKTGALLLHSMATGESKTVDRDPTSSPISVQWSADHRWITWSRSEDQRSPNSVLWVYNVENGTKQQVTSGFFNDDSPVFDRKGDYIYFASNRSFNSPKYDDVGQSFVYTDTQILMAMPLRADVNNPLLAKSDEEDWKDETKKADDPEKKEADEKDDKGQDIKDKKDDGEKSGKDGAEKKEKGKEKKKAIKPFEIDFNGIEARSFQIPVKSGRFGDIAVNDKGHLIYSRSGGRRGGDGEGGIKLLDLTADKIEEKKVVDGTGNFSISIDGKNLMIIKGENDFFVVEAAADQKLENPVSKSGMTMNVDPRAEWKQVFTDSWRVERDFFYDPNMHGVDWPKIRDHYASMLQDCVSRRDVSFLIKEMIAEINVGHAYYNEGDVEKVDSVSVGLLGCRFQAADGGYKMVDFWQGADWDVDARNPLAQASVKEGQFLLAVNGIPFSTQENPYKAFVGKAGMTVMLTVSDDNAIDDKDKKVPVKLLGSDDNLRFRHWIEAKRRIVEEKSNGKIGYIYVVNTGVPGQNDLVRMLSGQLNKEALIIDDRWNGGGQIPTRFIELLNRPATNAWARRDGRDWIWPPDSHLGPKCMLINGMAGSGGDMFPALFKQNKLGPLIGMRTWGGLVGISGGPTNIDGSSVTAPTFAYYEMDGTWGIEGHGVDPDIKVVDDPARMIDKGDPQLEVAIDEMLKAIKDNGFVLPKRPAYPDRSKMGINPKDK